MASTSTEFLSHVLRNFIEEIQAPKPHHRNRQKFLSHVLRNFIEDANVSRDEWSLLGIPEPCAQELH